MSNNNDKPKVVASAGSGASSNTGVRTLSDTTSVSGNELIRVVVTAQQIDNNATGNTVTSSSTYSGQSTGTATTSFSPTGTKSNIITDRPVGSEQPPAPLANASLVPLHHSDTLEPSSDYNYAGPTNIGDDFSDDEEIDTADIFASSREAGTNEKNITQKNNEKWVASGLGQFVDLNFGAKASVKAVQVSGKGVAEIHDGNDQPVGTVNLSGNHTYEFKEPVQTGKLIFVNQTPGRLELSHVRAVGSVEERPDQKDQKDQKDQNQNKESKKMGTVVPSNDTAIASEADTSDAAASDTSGSTDADIDTGEDDAAEENDETNAGVTGIDDNAPSDSSSAEDDSSSDDPMASRRGDTIVEKSSTDSITRKTRKR